jgi:hypothetical protein
MFPAGLPGIGLLLLRASVAIALLADDYTHRQALSGWEQAVALLISVALSLGILTPIAALTTLVFHGLIGWRLGVDSTLVAAIVCLNATALTLLGPGAYSVDSYRFGRRVVVLPPNRLHH